MHPLDLPQSMLYQPLFSQNRRAKIKIFSSLINIPSKATKHHSECHVTSHVLIFILDAVRISYLSHFQWHCVSIKRETET